MKYEKPEITVSAPALNVIHTQCSEKNTGPQDSIGCSGNKHNPSAAYEADE